MEVLDGLLWPSWLTSQAANSTHVAAQSKISSFFIAVWYSAMCRHPSFNIHLLNTWVWGICWPLLLWGKLKRMWLCMSVSWQVNNLIGWGMPGKDPLDHREALVLFFWGKLIPFSMKFKVYGALFPITSSSQHWSFHFQWDEDISYCYFDFTLIFQLSEMKNIFPQPCGPSPWLLWENACSASWCC